MPVGRTKAISRDRADDTSSAPDGAANFPELVVRNTREFLAGFQPSGGNGGVFCPTRRNIPVGEMVAVKVRLGRRQPPAVVYGRVAWRRPGRHILKIRAGIGVEFLTSESGKWEYLLDLARAGTSARSRRRHQRIPVDMPISWRPVSRLDGFTGNLRDVGRGGAFVLSTASVAIQEKVVLEIAPPGAEVPMAFIGRVAWIGKSGTENVFGIEWRARDAGGGRRIKELVRRLSGLQAPLRV
jgi:Tfp pilus assembly protein PilZ